jgi:uncharacterized membrane protein YkvA (DUF1232 family)
MSDNWPENDPNWKLGDTFQGVSEDDGPIVVEVPGPAGSTALDRFWAAVRRLPRYAFLGTNLIRDDRVPRRVKATIAVGGIYAISPIDLVPGIIPVAGQLDDLVVVLLALRRAIRTCSPEVAEEHLRRAGLSVDDFDNDLRAVRDTAIWLAQKGYRATRSFVAKGSERLRSLWANR